MDDELKIELSKLLNPYTILPNLRLSRPHESPEHNLSPDDSNQSPQYNISPDYSNQSPLYNISPDYSNQSPQYSISPDDSYQSDDASEEIDEDDDYTPDENSTDPLPKKKRSKLAKFFSLSENCTKYPGMTSRDLHFRIQGDKVIEFCQEHGLIASEVICSCGKPMRLVSKGGNDGCRWMCYDKTHNARPNQTIRKGTWFESSKLSLGDILWIAYMWVHEYSIVSMMHECDHSNSTVMGWCSCCTDFCREVVEYKSKPIGGEEISVEIFYCAIKDNKQLTGRWAFCAVEFYSTNSLHLIIDDNNSFTLLQIFDRYVLPGTKVVANNWSLLKTLNIEDFNYLTKKGSISFIDLGSNKKIDSFEMFERMATRPSKPDEWSKFDYGSEFFEKMYRKCLKSTADAFLAFLKDVSMIYKPCDKYCTNSIETI